MINRLLILYKTAIVNNDIYNITQSYCNNFDKVDSYFIVCDETLDQDYQIQDRLIKFRLKEDNWESLLIKVIKAFHIFKDKKYTHIMVANVSSFVNIPVMYSRLSNALCMSHTGKYSFKNIKYMFPSGAGYVFSVNLVDSICEFFEKNQYIVNNQLTKKFTTNYPTTDDIFFGYYFHLNNIKIKELYRVDVLQNDFIASNTIYSHYRVKCSNGNKIFRDLFKSIYP